MVTQIKLINMTTGKSHVIGFGKPKSPTIRKGTLTQIIQNIYRPQGWEENRRDSCIGQIVQYI